MVIQGALFVMMGVSWKVDKKEIRDNVITISGIAMREGCIFAIWKNLPCETVMLKIIERNTQEHAHDALSYIKQSGFP